MSDVNSPRVAVVSGAAGGIGQAFAQQLARDGLDVVVVDLKDGVETCELVQAEGRRGWAIVGDITKPEEVERIRDETLNQFGKVSVLVNNAGAYPVKAFNEISWSDWRNLMSLNLDSMFLMAKAFVPSMMEDGWGRIVNLASNTIGLTVGGMSHYIATKGGVIGFTRGLANDLGVYGITVNAIAPGLTKTASVIDRSGGPVGRTQDDEFEAIAQLQAIKRTLVPEDLVGMLSYLVSEKSSVFTGQTVYVDGGLVRV